VFFLTYSQEYGSQRKLFTLQLCALLQRTLWNLYICLCFSQRRNGKSCGGRIDVRPGRKNRKRFDLAWNHHLNLRQAVHYGTSFPRTLTHSF